MKGYLHAVPAWGRITGSPLCAIEQAALCRDAFAAVDVVLNQTGPLIERIQRLALAYEVIPVEYRGLRSGGLGHLLRHFSAVAASRWRYVTGVRRLLKQKTGILHVHSRVLCGMYACLAGRWARVPVVLTLHEPPARSNLRARFDGWWLRRLPDVVVAASAATAREYRQFLKHKTIPVVRYCMTALPADVNYHRNGKPILAFIGLTTRKRPGDFLTACRMLKERGLGFEAWLVGEWDAPADRTRAENYLRRHGLESVVVQKGLVQDMAALYRAVAAVAVPSEPVEALPRVVMEAMSYGLPVVATRVNGVPEMVVDGETGFMIAVGDVAALAGRLEELVRDPARRESLGRAARARAEDLFAPERFRSEMLAIYRELVPDE